MSVATSSQETGLPIQIVMMPHETTESTNKRTESVDLCLACQRCVMCACKLTDCCCCLCLIIIATCICLIVLFFKQCNRDGMIKCF